MAFAVSKHDRRTGAVTVLSCFVDRYLVLGSKEDGSATLMGVDSPLFLESTYD